MILNLFFVIVCKMAADGVALASIISQYLSAVLVLLHMTRLTDSCRVEWKLLRPRRPGGDPAYDLCGRESVHSGRHQLV